jgi:hypothetical protein
MGEQDDRAQPAPVTTIVCPHCRGMIELGAGQGGPAGAGMPAADAAARGGGNGGRGVGNGVEQWLGSVIGRGLTRVIGEHGTVPRWMIIGGMLVAALILGGYCWLGAARRQQHRNRCAGRSRPANGPPRRTNSGFSLSRLTPALSHRNAPNQ